jgi:hypothetical protein
MATKGETIVDAEIIDIANFSKLAATLPKNLWQPKPLLAVGTGGASGIHTGHKLFGSQNQLWQNSAKELWHCQLLFLIFFCLPFCFATNKRQYMHRHTTQPTQHPAHTTQFPPKKNAITANHLDKALGKVDRAALHDLVLDGSVNISNHSYTNIDAVQAEYFPHRTVRNFWRNFKDFSGAFDLEEGLIGARRGMMRVCGFINYFIYVLLTSRPCRRRRRRRHHRH